MKLRKILIQGLQTLVFAFCLLAVAPMAMADYEIGKSKVVSDVPTDGTIVQWGADAGDMTIEWEIPSITTPDIFMGFIYKWNDSDTELDNDAFGENTNDGEIEAVIEPPSITMDAGHFIDDDSNSVRYLHIKTKYRAAPFAYSDDVVIGPINIDNVAPTGTIKITNDEGIEIDSTSNSLLNISLIAEINPTHVYLNETLTQPTEETEWLNYVTEMTYDLENTYSDGDNITIYAWFEDNAGNISSAPATYNVTFEEEDDPSLKGDVNGDQKINYKDAIIVLQYAASLRTLTEAELILANTFADENVNYKDAINILKYAAGIISNF